MTTRPVDPSVEAVLHAIDSEAGPFRRDLITLHPALLPILAQGRPAPPEELASATGRTTEELAQTLGESEDVEIDRRGRVLGMAISLLPTPHRIQLPVRTHLLYAWCIPDTFGSVRLLGEPMRVISTCPGTGQSVTLELEPDRIVSVDPPAAVMAWATRFDPDDARATGCGHMSLFASAEAAAAFQAGYPHVVNVPAADVLDFLGPVFDALVARATAGAGVR